MMTGSELLENWPPLPLSWSLVAAHVSSGGSDVPLSAQGRAGWAWSAHHAQPWQPLFADMYRIFAVHEDGGEMV